MNKRYQNCNNIQKLWRKRWYLPIPFQWLWIMYIYPKKNVTNENHKLTGKNLWHLLIGSAQIKMNWSYTQEEVMEKFKDTLDKLKQERED